MQIICLTFKKKLLNRVFKENKIYQPLLTLLFLITLWVGTKTILSYVLKTTYFYIKTLKVKSFYISGR